MKFKVQICETIIRNGYYIIHADDSETAEEYVEQLVDDKEIDKNSIKWDSKITSDDLISGCATFVE